MTRCGFFFNCMHVAGQSDPTCDFLIFFNHDLRHMYHAFACTSRKRFRTMVFGQPYRLSELKGTRALEQDFPYLNGQGEALVAFAGLGMGMEQRSTLLRRATGVFCSMPAL